MFDQLLINTLLLISFTFIGEHISNELSERLVNRFYGRVVLGIGGGVLGSLMIIYTIQVIGTNTLLDLRILSVIIVSSLGGFTSSAIAGAIMTVYRIGFFGVNQSSIFALIQICLCIIFFHIIDKKTEMHWKSWFAKLCVSVFILISTYAYLLRKVESSHVIILNFILVFIGTGTIEYFLLEYSRRSNELFKMYKKDSTKDFLTGLNNTRYFNKLLNMSFYRAIERREKLSCLMIDIDHFKRVNDTYGHAIGDIVLKELAKVLKKNCRTFDILGRVGGEEFCILLLDCSMDQAFEIAERIRRLVKEHKFLIEDDKFTNITVSIGIATYPDTALNLEELKEKADAALYIAKQTGRDKVCKRYQ